MLKLIHSNFYQLLKSRSFIIFCFSAFLLTFLTVIAIYYGNELSMEAEMLIQMFVTPDMILEIYSLLLQSVSPMICFVVAIIAFSDEIRLRTFINSISVGIPRYQIYLSKFIVSFLLGLIGIFISYVTLMIAYQILIGGAWQPFFDYIIEFILPNMVLWAAYLSLFLLFRFSFSSNAIDMMLIMLWIFLPLILSFVNREWVHRIQPYLINELRIPSGQLVLGMDINIIVSLTYLIVFLGIGIFFFNRREI